MTNAVSQPTFFPELLAKIAPEIRHEVCWGVTRSVITMLLQEPAVVRSLKEAELNTERMSGQREFQARGGEVTPAIARTPSMPTAGTPLIPPPSEYPKGRDIERRQQDANSQ